MTSSLTIIVLTRAAMAYLALRVITILLLIIGCLMLLTHAPTICINFMKRPRLTLLFPARAAPFLNKELAIGCTKPKGKLVFSVLVARVIRAPGCGIAPAISLGLRALHTEA